MAEYIEREALLSAFELADYPFSEFEDAFEMAENAPPSDVAPVVHGKWIPVEAYGIGNTAKCSECEKRQYGYDGFKFCPNCGAKMDGD